MKQTRRLRQIIRDYRRWFVEVWFASYFMIFHALIRLTGPFAYLGKFNIVSTEFRSVLCHWMPLDATGCHWMPLDATG